MLVDSRTSLSGPSLYLRLLFPLLFFVFRLTNSNPIKTAPHQRIILIHSPSLLVPSRNRHASCRPPLQKSTKNTTMPSSLQRTMPVRVRILTRSKPPQPLPGRPSYNPPRPYPRPPRRGFPHPTRRESSHLPPRSSTGGQSLVLPSPCGRQAEQNISRRLRESLSATGVTATTGSRGLGTSPRTVNTGTTSTPLPALSTPPS